MVAKKTPDPALVAALEYELEGYRRRGLADRIDAVEAELKALGAPVRSRKAAVR